MTLNGGILCCDFVNTVYAWRGENLHEYLGDYIDFIAWCKKLSIYNNSYLNSLQKIATTEPAKCTTAMKTIKEVRELLYHFISAIAAKKYKEVRRLLPAINEWIAASLSHVCFEFKSNQFISAYDQKLPDLISPLWKVLHSLYDLLTKEDTEKVKECPRCGWVFLDTTKNGKRRWCDPAECGTADKMKRYYKRKKEERG